MLRKLFTVAILTSVSAATVVATGCTSSTEQPSALTGDRTTMNDNWKYTDQKGHYRPELRRDAEAKARPVTEQG
jgi:hypothetical protein